MPFVDRHKFHCLCEHRRKASIIQVEEGNMEGFLEEVTLEMSLDEGVKLIQMKERVSFSGRRKSM